MATYIIFEPEIWTSILQWVRLRFSEMITGTKRWEEILELGVEHLLIPQERSTL